MRMTGSSHSGTSLHCGGVTCTPTRVLGALCVLLGGAWGTAGCFSEPPNDVRATSDAPATGTSSETEGGEAEGGDGAVTSSATATTSDAVDPKTTATTSGTDGPNEGSSDGSTGPCTEVGCLCDVNDDLCDDPLACSLGVCTMPECGDGTIDETEQCDDGNDEDGDGCDNDCSYTEIQLDAGGNQTCALIEGGRVRCWGDNRFGQLGYGNTLNVGDNESPWEVGDIQLPAGVLEIRAGGSHVCALTENLGDVICWGHGDGGVLGTGDETALGDDELPANVSPVAMGAEASGLSSGGSHNCILDTSSQVRCWGSAFLGSLGYGNNESIGDNELPAAAGTVEIGATAIQVTAGLSHTCAVLSDGRVRCWGFNSSGQLGIGSVQPIGDDELPDTTTPLSFGVGAVKVVTGWLSTCTLFEDGTVRCWGRGEDGTLGRGDGSEEAVGDDESVINVEPVDLGGARAIDITAGSEHTCVLLDSREVLCWGRNASGEVGNGDFNPVGDDETPGDAGPVVLDGDVLQIASGAAHVCVVLEDYRVRCWGEVGFGRLGLGSAVQSDVADPLSVDPVEVLEPL